MAFDSEAFKLEVKPKLQLAVIGQGGLKKVRWIYGEMPSILDFVVGWIVRDFERPISPEEVRRIYDIVRLELDTQSSTS